VAELWRNCGSAFRVLVLLSWFERRCP
jgi:hypothetical protein